MGGGGKKEGEGSSTATREAVEGVRAEEIE